MVPHCINKSRTKKGPIKLRNTRAITNNYLTIGNIRSDEEERKIKIGKPINSNQIEHYLDEVVKHKSNGSYCKTLSGDNDDSSHADPSTVQTSQHKEATAKICERKVISQNFSDNNENLLWNNVKFDAVYTCSFCEHVFLTKYTLARHKRIHNFCQYCKTKLKSRKEIATHIKTCILAKCMISQPKVNLTNIAMSKKLRSIHKLAFDKETFPPLNWGLEVKTETETETIQERNNESTYSISNCASIKSEPQDVEYEVPTFYQNYLHDNVEQLVKSEAIDIVEEQLFHNESFVGHVKDEANSDYNCVESTAKLLPEHCYNSKEESDLIKSSVPDKSIKSINSNLIIASKLHNDENYDLKAINDEKVEESLSENEEDYKIRRFSEAIDIVEEQLFHNESFVGHVQEEAHSDYNCVESTAKLLPKHCCNIKEESDFIKSSVPDKPDSNFIIASKSHNDENYYLKAINDEKVEESLSENEENYKIRRFSRFKSEVEQTLSESDTEYSRVPKCLSEEERGCEKRKFLDDKPSANNLREDYVLHNTPPKNIINPKIKQGLGVPSHYAFQKTFSLKHPFEDLPSTNLKVVVELVLSNQEIMENQPKCTSVSVSDGYLGGSLRNTSKATNSEYYHNFIKKTDIRPNNEGKSMHTNLAIFSERPSEKKYQLEEIRDNRVEANCDESEKNHKMRRFSRFIPELEQISSDSDSDYPRLGEYVKEVKNNCSNNKLCDDKQLKNILKDVKTPELLAQENSIQSKIRVEYPSHYKLCSTYTLKTCLEPPLGKIPSTLSRLNTSKLVLPKEKIMNNEHALRSVDERYVADSMEQKSKIKTRRKKIVYDLESSSFRQSNMKCIRFTDKPNLNLFLL